MELTLTDTKKNYLKNNNRDVFFQPKLSINQPNDVYEQEADAMADKVMRMSANDTSFFSPAYSLSFGEDRGEAQRKCKECEEEEKHLHRKETNNNEVVANNSTENYITSLNGKGRSLSSEERNFFEPKFGYDFSNVQLHTNNEANQSAKDINALAYTHGDNIVFGSNQYQPNTESGKRLMAHELTHVVQQTYNTNAVVQRDLAIEPTNPVAQPPALTHRQIQDAIFYNNIRYSPSSIRIIQDVVGADITGTMDESTINLVALYQAENGFAADGMVGPDTFNLITSELHAEGVSNDNCLTMFLVSLRTPMDIHAGAAVNTADIFGHFDVEIRFSPHCDCSQFEYRQFISGSVTFNGADFSHQFSIPPGNVLPAVGNFIEDGNTTLPNNGRYGHRNLPPNQGLPNQYENDNGDVDMTNGCIFKSFDEPGVIGAPANSGDVYVFDFRFMGEILRNGKMFERKFWSVRERIVIP